MERALCVYGSSSDAIEEPYFAVARQLGTEMARRGYSLIFGGGRVGLMGAVARAVHASGGRVVGVIPEQLYRYGIAYEEADELVIARDMRDRKATMEAGASGFICLPGGFGTLEELLEIITHKQLHIHAKPIVVVNVNGYYTPLEEMLENTYRYRFVKPHYRDLYHVAGDAQEVFEYLDSYEPPQLPAKWKRS